MKHYRYLIPAAILLLALVMVLPAAAGPQQQSEVLSYTWYMSPLPTDKVQRVHLTAGTWVSAIAKCDDGKVDTALSVKKKDGDFKLTYENSGYGDDNSDMVCGKNYRAGHIRFKVPSSGDYEFKVYGWASPGFSTGPGYVTLELTISEETDWDPGVTILKPEHAAVYYNLPSADGRLPCGVFDVPGHGPRRVKLEELPLCKSKKGYHVMCITEGKWNGINITNVNLQGPEKDQLWFTSAQHGVCAAFGK